MQNGAPGDPARRGPGSLLEDPCGSVENVAAVIALVVEDDRAAAQVDNVSESVSFSEADWVRRIAEVIGWTGEVATVPEGRIPVPYHFDQDLDTDSHRIREELGFAEIVRLHDWCWKGRSPGSEPQTRPSKGLCSESWMKSFEPEPLG